MNETTTQLIEDCRHGKRNAQLALYKQHAQRLYTVCLRIVGNRNEAEEAMQDAFLKIFAHIDQYQEEQRFEAWMQRIAVRTAIDYLRRQTPEWEELSESFPEPEPDTPDEEEISYSVQQVKEAMNRLPNGFRVILSLYLFEGYDAEEISTILHIQPASVRSQYLRAKRKLLDILNK